jgi:hypothetical protein
MWEFVANEVYLLHYKTAFTLQLYITHRDFQRCSFC